MRLEMATVLQSVRMPRIRPSQITGFRALGLRHFKCSRSVAPQDSVLFLRRCGRDCLPGRSRRGGGRKASAVLPERWPDPPRTSGRRPAHGQARPRWRRTYRPSGRTGSGDRAGSALACVGGTGSRTSWRGWFGAGDGSRMTKLSDASGVDDNWMRAGYAWVCNCLRVCCIFHVIRSSPRDSGH